MTPTFAQTESSKSIDVFFVNPLAIELPKDRCGDDKSLEHTIVEMALSLVSHGQRRPVECRRTKDGNLLLEHGLVRTLAARLICTGFKYIDSATGKEVVAKDKKFRLKVVAVCH